MRYMENAKRCCCASPYLQVLHISQAHLSWLPAPAVRLPMLLMLPRAVAWFTAFGGRSRICTKRHRMGVGCAY